MRTIAKRLIGRLPAAAQRRLLARKYRFAIGADELETAVSFVTFHPAPAAAFGAASLPRTGAQNSTIVMLIHPGTHCYHTDSLFHIMYQSQILITIKHLKYSSAEGIFPVKIYHTESNQ